MMTRDKFQIGRMFNVLMRGKDEVLGMDDCYVHFRYPLTYLDVPDIKLAKPSSYLITDASKFLSDREAIHNLVGGETDFPNDFEDEDSRHLDIKGGEILATWYSDPNEIDLSMVAE